MYWFWLVKIEQVFKGSQKDGKIEDGGANCRTHGRAGCWPGRVEKGGIPDGPYFLCEVGSKVSWASLIPPPLSSSTAIRQVLLLLPPPEMCSVSASLQPYCHHHLLPRLGEQPPNWCPTSSLAPLRSSFYTAVKRIFLEQTLLSPMT